MNPSFFVLLLVTIPLVSALSYRLKDRVWSKTLQTYMPFIQAIKNRCRFRFGNGYPKQHDDITALGKGIPADVNYILAAFYRCVTNVVLGSSKPDDGLFGWKQICYDNASSVEKKQHYFNVDCTKSSQCMRYQ